MLLLAKGYEKDNQYHGSFSSIKVEVTKKQYSISIIMVKDAIVFIREWKEMLWNINSKRVGDYYIGKKTFQMEHEILS